MVGADLPASRLAEAAQLLARAMLDNPTHVAVFGTDARQRRLRLQHFFGTVLPFILRHGRLVVAQDAQGRLLGIMGALPPGRCQPRMGQRLQLGWRLARGLRPDVLLRSLRWLLAWQASDPAGPHWHLGPLAVAPEQRGQGVGGRLLRQMLAQLPADGAPCYLETDLQRNVDWYRRCGFELVAEKSVLGVPNRFMQRERQLGTEA